MRDDYAIIFIIIIILIARYSPRGGSRRHSEKKHAVSFSQEQ